jgi:hypothetical protein
MQTMHGILWGLRRALLTISLGVNSLSATPNEAAGELFIIYCEHFIIRRSPISFGKKNVIPDALQKMRVPVERHRSIGNLQRSLRNNKRSKLGTVGLYERSNIQAVLEPNILEPNILEPNILEPNVLEPNVLYHTLNFGGRVCQGGA